MKNLTFVFILVFVILSVGLLGIVLVFADENDTNATNSANQTTICDSDNLNLCLDESACEAEDVGGYWYDGICNEEEQEKAQEGEEEESENGSGAQVSKTKLRNRTSVKFVPWQKRNESECLEGCKCVGAVMSCPTETGKIMTIEAGRSGNIITITVNRTKVDTELELEQERDQERNKTKLKAKLSAGNLKEIKIMPNVASEIALKRLRLKVCSEENNCTIILKEIALKRGIKNETDAARLAYEVQVERHAKLLWLFRAKMRNRIQIDAETGDIIKVKKPWWAFLAAEPEE